MTSTIEGVFVDLTGSLARSDMSARGFAELSDDQSECLDKLDPGSWQIIRTNGDFCLVPPPAADPTRTPIRLRSKSPLKLESPLRLPA